MKLGSKIVLATGVAIIMTITAMVLTVLHVSRENRVEALRHQMSTIISQSEDVASNMDKLYAGKAFDFNGLMSAAKEQAGAKSLKETYRDATIYRSIPIVAAWKSVENAAAKEGFDFFTPTHPDIKARNPKNESGTKYKEAFDAFESGSSEFFKYDEANSRLILARPVKLQQTCLSCHGDPKSSITGDGMDPLGFPMENLKVGTIKGAFILEAPMKDDKVIAQTMTHMIMIGVGLLIILMGLFYAFSHYAIIKPLSQFLGLMKNASEQTTGASSQIANASQSLASGSSEQAASLEETSASLEELTSMTRRNAENASSGSDEMKKTRAASEKSSTNMAELSTSMHEMSKIVKSIDEIAFQTNILALNAAVEAARAGEAGMGFAVVADEVRNLAKRSADAAHETASKIEQSVNLTQKVEDNLNEVVEQARIVDQLITEIATASREQSTGLDQINIAVTQMDKVTQNTAASSEETASAAEELSAQARAMEDELNKLVSMVGGTESGSPAPAPAPRIEVRPPQKPARALSSPASPISRAERLGQTTPKATIPKLTSGNENKGTPKGSIPMPGMDKDFEEFQ